MYKQTIGRKKIAFSNLKKPLNPLSAIKIAADD